MKIVRAKEMVRAESSAYAAGGSDVQFMEAAGRGIAERVEDFVQLCDGEWAVTLLCGGGNNAGDAYVAGCHLKQLGYSVRAIQLVPMERCSALCQKNHNRFLSLGGEVRFARSGDSFQFLDRSVILDGVLGTGFHGQVEGLFAEAIEAANQSGLPILSIDIPSGVNGNTGAVEGVAIEADVTIFLGLPKSGFFIGSAWNHVGVLEGVDFGIDARFLEDAQADFELFTDEEAASLLPPVVRNRNKYEAGAVAGLAGSPTMPGAAILASFSALRGGAGLVRLYHPEGMEGVLASAPPEIIRIPYRGQNDLVAELNRVKGVFVGPGIGREPEIAKLLAAVLPNIEHPCVIDADALFLLASEEGVKLPKESVLTPHSGEFATLIGRKGEKLSSWELIEAAQAYVEKVGCVLVLKGGPSFVFVAGRSPTVVPYGDPGMATAGSGDVLTGVIAAFLAQGLSPYDAARLGVYIHGRAGEFAAAERGAYSMVASDITEALPTAFFLLSETLL